MEISLFLQQPSQSVSLWDVLAAYFIGQDELLGTLAFAGNRLQISLIIVFLAGLSDAVGNSVILIANQVRPFRFFLALLANALLFLFNYLAWALSLMLVATQVFGLTTERPFFFAVVALSYIPILFSALSFLPVIGYPIRLLLYGISTIYLIRIINAATELTFTTAFICAIVGFIFLELVQATVGRPLIHFGQWVVTTAAGHELEQNIEAALRFNRYNTP